MKLWDPDFYDKHCVLQYKTSIDMIKNISLKGNEIILNVGCGTGKFDYYLATQVPKGRVEGIDVSVSMIKFAKNHYSLPNLFFLCQDILEMSSQNRYDLVISFWTLSWIANQTSALNNIINSMKPGGRMLLMYPLRHDAYDVVGLMIKTPKWAPYFTTEISPRPFFTEYDYRKLLANISGIKISVVKKEISCHFQDTSEMKASILSWMTYLDRLPQAQLKQLFLDEFCMAYIAHRKISQPIMYFSILEINGTKLDLNKTNENDDTSSEFLRAKL